MKAEDSKKMVLRKKDIKSTRYISIKNLPHLKRPAAARRKSADKNMS